MKITFDKKDSQYEVLRYEKDSNGFCLSLCPYGQGFDKNEYHDMVKMAKFSGWKPCKTYLIGSVMCVRKCKYMVDKIEGINAIMCSFRANHPDTISD